MKSILIAVAAFSVLFVGGFAAVAQSPASQEPRRKQSPTPAAGESAEGEKRFEVHCGRCHVPPDDLSPREARAVLRQMRVRANLTAEDERLILKYLAP
jgi:mono/diheme cytochrome c family protein